MTRALLVSVSLLLLSGCVSPIATETLDDPTSVSCIHIEDTSFWQEPRGLVGLTWEEGVTAGEYKSEFENSKGTFYRGDGRPVWQRAFDKEQPKELHQSAFVWEGGIWLPKKNNEKPKLYYYYEAALTTAEDIGEYTRSYTESAVHQGANAGTTVVGSVIGGAIVNAMIQADVGKIFFFPEINDEALIGTLKNMGECQ